MFSDRVTINAATYVVENRNGKNWVNIVSDKAKEFSVKYAISQSAILLAGNIVSFPLGCFLAVITPVEMGDGSIHPDDYQNLLNKIKESAKQNPTALEKITAIQIKSDHSIVGILSASKGYKVIATMYPWPDDFLKNPNCRESMTGHNWTPLHVAVHHGDAQMVKVLLANGALILKDKTGHFPEEVQLWGRYANRQEGYNEAKQALKAVAEQGRGVSQYAWPTDDILTNPNVRETTGNSWTPLHVAVHHGDAQMVKALLANGALILKDKTGHFPEEVQLWGRYANHPEGYNEAKQALKAVTERAHQLAHTQTLKAAANKTESTNTTTSATVTISPAKVQPTIQNRNLANEHQVSIMKQQLENDRKADEKRRANIQDAIQKAAHAQLAANLHYAQISNQANNARFNAQCASLKKVYEPHIHQAKIEIGRGGNPSGIGLFGKGTSSSCPPGYTMRTENGRCAAPPSINLKFGKK